MSAAVILQYRNPKRKRHHEIYLENEKGGWLSRLVEPCQDEAKLGEGFLPSPKQPGARATRPQAGNGEEKRQT
jgi:hypothetical protein